MESSFGVTIGHPSTKHDYNLVMPRLGTCPDSVLADELSCDASLIGKLRRSLSIPRYNRMEGVGHLLGRVSDHDLARRMCGKVTRQTIRLHRRRLNISPFNRKQAAARSKLERYVSQLKEQLES